MMARTTTKSWRQQSPDGVPNAVAKENPLSLAKFLARQLTDRQSPFAKRLKKESFFVLLANLFFVMLLFRDHKDVFKMKKSFFSVVAATVVLSFGISSSSFAAAPEYQVSMRVGLKGQAPISVNTVAKSGKKSFVSEFSDDGQNETIVEVLAKKSQVNHKDGIFMDVIVTKRVRGVKKASERAQVFALENQEMEFGVGSKGRMAGNMSLAVMAHQL